MENSRRPTKRLPTASPPAKGSPPPRVETPPRRQTMEVQMAWLEELEAPVDSAPALSSRKKPPRLPGAARTLPPMPVVPPAPPRPSPPRNHTIEVEMAWLEFVDDEKKVKASGAQAGERNEATADAGRLPTKEALEPCARGRKPIPREED